MSTVVADSATPYRSVAVAFRVLDSFTSEAPEWRVTDLARALGSSKSTLSRLLGIMARAGYLRRTPAGGRYALSLRFLRLAEVAQTSFDVARTAEPFVRELWRVTRGTVTLRVLEGHELVTVSILESPEPVRVSHPRGGRVPCTFGAHGKAVLAAMAAADRDRLLDARPPRALTPRTIVSRAPLLAALAETRRRGFAFSDGEAVAGTRAVAAAVVGPDGRPLAALGASFPTSAAPAARVLRHCPAVRDVAARLSAQLGRRAPARGARARAGSRGHVPRGLRATSSPWR